MAEIQLKTPDADLVYTFDWSDDIPDGVLLQGVVHMVPAPLAIVLEQTDPVSKLSTVQISGGVHGKTYLVKALATLDEGEDVPGMFTLRVSNG